MDIQTLPSLHFGCWSGLEMCTIATAAKLNCLGVQSLFVIGSFLGPPPRRRQRRKEHDMSLSKFLVVALRVAQAGASRDSRVNQSPSVSGPI